MPENTSRLIEPFAGSAAMSLASLHARKVNKVIISDIDGALIALWKQIIDFPEEIADAYSLLWYRQLGDERSFYDFVRSEFNLTHRPDYFLYLLARCVKAAVRYNANGDFNQSPDNRRKGTHPDTMRQSILETSKLLKGNAVVRHTDYRQLLSEATQDDIIYLDPPYQGVCKTRDPRYREKITFDNFVNALKDLNSQNSMFIVSYDGRTEDKTYGRFLPDFLHLTHIELDAGRSSQATLLGRRDKTFEALYLSSALMEQMNLHLEGDEIPLQLSLLEM